MCEAKLESEWDRTAGIIAKLHNVNVTKTSDMIRDQSVLNPIRAARRRGNEQRLTLAEIKEAMTGRKRERK